MPYILTRRVRTRQPRGIPYLSRPIYAVIDCANNRLISGENYTHKTAVNGVGQNGVGYALISGGTASYPVNLAIGTGDFTLAGVLDHPGLVYTYNYVTGSNLSYFAFSISHAAGNAAFNDGTSRDLGIYCRDAGVYHWVVRRRSGILYANINNLSSSQTNTKSIGTVTNFVAGSYQQGAGNGLTRGTSYFHCLDDKAWTDGETSSFIDNPWQIFEDEEELIWIPEAGGGGATVAITGQSYTPSQGTHGIDLSKSVTGQAYTHTQGTLSASVSTSATVALTGQSYTLSQGSLTQGTGKALTGQSYTLSQGTLGVSTSATVALTGQSYTISQGDLGVSTSATVDITGQSYTFSQGAFGVSAGSGATVALTNQTYTISQGTLGVSTSATVALTGQGYTHTQGTLGVSVGNNVTVALTGQDLNYSQGTFAPGVALAIAGQTYSLSQGTLAVVVGNNATVALTGQSYALTQGLVGVAATVGLTGQYISFAQGTLGVTTDTGYYVSLAGQSYALTQGVLGVTNDTNYIVPLMGQSYTYSQRAPSVLGATIPLSEMRLYIVPPEDRRYTVPTY